MLTGADDLDYVLRPTAYTLGLSTKSAGTSRSSRLDAAAPHGAERYGDCKVGGPNDQDKPGQKENCCGGGGECGYTWCSKLDKCTRSWEC